MTIYPLGYPVDLVTSSEAILGAAAKSWDTDFPRCRSNRASPHAAPVVIGETTFDQVALVL